MRREKNAKLVQSGLNSSMGKIWVSTGISLELVGLKACRHHFPCLGTEASQASLFLAQSFHPKLSDSQRER